MKNILLLLFLGITTNLIAQDDRWVYVGQSNDGSEGTSFYYDKETLEYKTSSVVMWVKIVCEPRCYDEIYYKYEMYTLMQIEFYCKKRKSKIVARTTYYEDKSIERNDFGEDSPESPITPETMEETLYQTVCK
jgi:hypothetical protein